jgi:hypothetical protein
MRKILKVSLAALASSIMAACSMFGHSGVDIASYKVLEKDGSVEIRRYDSMVLATTDMPGGMDKGDNQAFQKLFDYISGANISADKIAMTAPVFMQETQDGQKIAMTAPVFMNENSIRETMSFVLPANFSFESAPKPTDPNVRIGKIENLTVAAIQFSGFLNSSNIQSHKDMLENWIKSSAYTQIAPYQVAGYNPPWTIPLLRRNEVLIPVEKK